MPTRIELPTCLTDALKELFPTLQWERISFFIGIKWPFSLGSQNAITLPSGYSGIHIYINPDDYQPCEQWFFVMCAHELVHALQIQESFAGGKGLGLFNPYAIKYGTCYAKEYSHKEDEGNPYEDEAYEYERILDEALNNFTDHEKERLPCTCGTIPFGTANSSFKGVAALAEFEPRVVKRKANKKGLCRGRIFGGLKITGTPEGDNILGWTLAGAIIGSFIVPGPGTVLGAVIGGVLGLIDTATGILSDIVVFVATIVLAIVSAIASLVSALIDWLAPGDRPLNVIFSQDDGLTFADLVTVGATGEPPALTFSSDHLFIGWVNSDNELNLLKTPDVNYKKWEWTSDDCGPALSWGNGRLYLVWQRKKNRIVSRTSMNGQDFTARVRVGGKVPDDATPGVAFGASRVFVAWIRKKNNKIGIISSGDNGASWDHETTLNAKSRNHGSAAIVFADSRLYLAWATKKEQYLRIGTLEITGSGTVTMSHTLKLDVRCKKDTGPAIAFGNNRIFLAWVGREDKLNVRSFSVSSDGQLSQISDVRLNRRGKKNAGPALAYGMNVLALGWVRKNR